MFQPSPVVSVVVPIYKVERYLAQCVDSMLAQTLRDIEVILVDDGSPDACPGICDAYAAQDSRVRVIHQENGGYGKAVNVGIDAAKAPYIGIIESDDWIEPAMYEKLYRRAVETGVDVVKCMFWKYESTSTPESRMYYGEAKPRTCDKPLTTFLLRLIGLRSFFIMRLCGAICTKQGASLV